MKKYSVIGLMSGTSLDGLDIAFCEFSKNKTWQYKIIYAETIKYNKEWKEKLSSAFRMKTDDLKKADVEYGKFIGSEILKFIKRKKIHPDFISSHGHTVFHQPDKGITLQIGNGKIISSICKLPVVCDFRSGDVALGGQGAPLVSIADKLLFSEYDFCLNLGGIANISFDNQRGERIAFDICPANIVLNYLANQFGKDFDRDGKIAAKGVPNYILLEVLNALPFYKMKPPKSLGREWIEKNFFSVLDSFQIPVEDKLKTAVIHITEQITAVVNSQLPTPNSQLLITGGGTYNSNLILCIKHRAKHNVILPDDKTIQFKEAMAFAFLGVLRMRNEINILKSVTGATKNSSGGKIYFAD